MQSTKWNETLTKAGQGLLTATCLTAVAAVPAAASTFTQSTKFSSDNNSPTILPSGTTEVDMLGEDYLGYTREEFQYFELSGLTPGDTLNFTFTHGSIFEGDFSIYNSANTSTPLFSTYNNVTSSLSVPSGGNLTFEYWFDGNYSNPISLTTDATYSSATPEPGTTALAGAALAGVLAWRRRRSK